MEATGEQNETTYEVLEDPKQREVLKRRVVDLVSASEGVGTIFFLDKSARPLAYFYIKAFHKLHPGRKTPSIRFLNIGSEKIEILAGYSLGIPERPTIDEVLDTIRDRDDLEVLFGTENVGELQELLKQGSQERRLIVDDVDYSGRTRSLTEKVVSVLDALNIYSFFTFLESPPDKARFDTGRGLRGVSAAFPWHGDNGFVKSPESLYRWDNRFLVDRQENIQYRPYSEQVRRELKILAEEIPVKGE